MKVLLAMQKNKVSAECFGNSSGYGYDDIGRETLEKVYADFPYGSLSGTPADHMRNSRAGHCLYSVISVRVMNFWHLPESLAILWKR